jgi:hypothetical protein
MCDPVSIGLGAATAGAKGFGAYAKHQEGQMKADAANAASINKYNYENDLQTFKNQERAAIYRQKLREYDANLISFKDAAYGGYRREQERLNEVYESARVTSQGQAVELLQKQGALTASNIAQGTSTRRAAANLVAQYGYNQAMLAQNIVGARGRFQRSIEDINRQWQSAQNRAYSQVAIAPRFGPRPPAPEMVQGPSNLGLIAGLADAAVSGITTGAGLSAPNTQTSGAGPNLDYSGGAMTDAFDSSATGIGDFGGFGGGSGIDWNQGFGVSEKLKWND